MKDKKKQKKLIVVFIAILAIFWIYIAIDSGTSNKPGATSKTAKIGEHEAVSLCQSYYEQLYEKGTGFEAKIGMFSDYNITENADTWILRVWGKCQNAFGAWMQIPARCQVKKQSVDKDWFNYKNIVDFKFER